VKFQKTQTLDRLAKWQNRKVVHDHKSMVSDRKLLQLSNKFERDNSEVITSRRTKQHQEGVTRFKTNQIKVKLEKLNFLNRQNYMENESFNEGQGLLTSIKSKHAEAEQKKNLTIEKLTQKTSEHIEKVMNRMEQAQLNEIERVESAL
jgi:hypothetical protein